jgi:hypothetical protein
MNRCSKTPLTFISMAAGALLISVSALSSSPAWAARVFPEKVQRGEMTFVALPEVLIDGRAERLDHSVRVYSERNTLLRPVRVNGRTAIVNYLRQGRDGRGKVREVWILTPAEAAAPLPDAVRSDSVTLPAASYEK